MAETLFWVEKSILVLGILCLITSMIAYGRRSHDWQGVITMFFKRVPLSIGEFKWYRLGITLVILAVILRIVVLTLWP
ncbi:hypothetical protein [Vibrio nitrifigilis]|uniref:Uncharacterized protein n=1 Tax=Vibrio nitrifigilis TaxID=2789781 RepID=A0ABS0GI12_9VIBR|nr:hypothetical protein [Vibrio nitrifigilis]MBF9002079.1 hypothetical protein [Vibrio nitrifigilis]